MDKYDVLLRLDGKIVCIKLNRKDMLGTLKILKIPRRFSNVVLQKILACQARKDFAGRDAIIREEKAKQKAFASQYDSAKEPKPKPKKKKAAPEPLENFPGSKSDDSGEDEAKTKYEDKDQPGPSGISWQPREKMLTDSAKLSSGESGDSSNSDSDGTTKDEEHENEDREKVFLETFGFPQ